MIQSMTGFGKSTVELPDKKEVKKETKKPAPKKAKENKVSAKETKQKNNNIGNKIGERVHSIGHHSRTMTQYTRNKLKYQ